MKINFLTLITIKWSIIGFISSLLDETLIMVLLVKTGQTGNKTADVLKFMAMPLAG